MILNVYYILVGSLSSSCRLIANIIEDAHCLMIKHDWTVSDWLFDRESMRTQCSRGLSIDRHEQSGHFALFVINMAWTTCVRIMYETFVVVFVVSTMFVFTQMIISSSLSFTLMQCPTNGGHWSTILPTTSSYMDRLMVNSETIICLITSRSMLWRQFHSIGQWFCDHCPCFVRTLWFWCRWQSVQTKS